MIIHLRGNARFPTRAAASHLLGYLRSNAPTACLELNTPVRCVGPSCEATLTVPALRSLGLGPPLVHRSERVRQAGQSTRPAPTARRYIVDAPLAADLHVQS